MIYVSEDQLEQVEYLIDQSIQGNHVLFDLKDIRRVLADKSSEFSEEEAYAVEPHIERLIEKPTLAQKKAYLDQLDRKTFKLVLRTYFNIVENSLYENFEVEH